jgi:uncharacterized protein YpmB
MDIVSTIVSVLSLLFIVIISVRLYTLFKRRKNISWDVKQGVRCYSCKTDMIEDLGLDEVKKFEKLMEIHDKYSKDPKREDFKLCVSCNRDDKLEGITSHKFFNGNRLNKIKKLLYSKKCDKVQIIMLILMIVFQVIDGLIKHYFHIRTMIGSLYTIFYWCVWYYKMSLTFGEKK